MSSNDQIGIDSGAAGNAALLDNKDRSVDQSQEYDHA